MGGAIAGLAVLVSFGTTLWGLIALASPRTAGLSSRWYSLPLLTSLFLFLGLAMIAFPDVGQSEQNPQMARGVGFFFVGFWIVFALIGFLAARSVKHLPAKASAKPQRAKSKSEKPTVKATNGPAKSDSVAADKVRQEIDAHRRMAAARMVAQQSEPPPREPFTPISRPAPPPRAPARERRPKIQPDREGIPRARTGKSIQFTYADADGVITDRQLVNWSRTSQQIEGFCLTRRSVRTFRMDRVIEWGDWE